VYKTKLQKAIKKINTKKYIISNLTTQ